MEAPGPECGWCGEPPPSHPSIFPQTSALLAPPTLAGASCTHLRTPQPVCVQSLPHQGPRHTPSPGPEQTAPVSWSVVQMGEHKWQVDTALCPTAHSGERRGLSPLSPSMSPPRRRQPTLPGCSLLFPCEHFALKTVSWPESQNQFSPPLLLLVTLKSVKQMLTYTHKCKTVGEGPSQIAILFGMEPTKF